MCVIFIIVGRGSETKLQVSENLIKITWRVKPAVLCFVHVLKHTE